jgi:hypothetical protein
MLQKRRIERLKLRRGQRAGDGVSTTTVQAVAVATRMTCIVCRGEISEALARLGSTKCHFCRDEISPPMANNRTSGLFPVRAGGAAKSVDY